MGPVKRHGEPPFRLAVLHGGPGAPGSAAGLAASLAGRAGVLEPWQSEYSVAGQVAELSMQLNGAAVEPAVLIGHSWGAWLAILTAAAHPRQVAKLILVGCAPLEETYVPEIGRRRLANLDGEERARYQELAARLESDEEGKDRNAWLRELGELSGKSDAYMPLPDPESDSVVFDGDQHRAVWKEAAQLRRSGELLQICLRLSCPLAIIHGEADPHPAAGVIEPLRKFGIPFSASVLERCGHTPWRELYAREAFFDRLHRETGD